MDGKAFDIRETLRQYGFIFSKPTGSSMRPLIWADDHWVAIAPMVSDPEVGDILLFEIEGTGKKIVHRLVDVRGDGNERVYITRGDNCLGCEEVRRCEIIGRVQEIHRLGRWRLRHAVHAKKISVTDRTYLRYTRFWMATWPVRRAFYRLRAWLRTLYARLK